MHFSMSLYLKIFFSIVCQSFLCLSFITIAQGDSSKSSQLVVLLVDGFRWDYLQHQGFKDILAHSVKPRWMVPIYPPVSYPNWQAISTGLYAENHGIIDNYIYDRDTRDFFMLEKNTTRHKHWWQTAEPIWITATRQNKTVSLYDWSRCDVPYRNMKPAKCKGYLYVPDPDFELFRSVMEEGLQDLKAGFDIVMIYTPEIDEIGHKEGPNSKNLTRGLDLVTDILKEFRTNLTEEHLINKVNVMFLSDHGMEEYGPEKPKRVYLDKYLDYNDVKHTLGTVSGVQIITEKGKVEKVFKDVKAMPGVTAYLVKDLPEKYHWKHNKNVPDIVLITDNTTLIEVPVNNTKQIPLIHKYLDGRGHHGYLPEITSDANAAMFAFGPGFKHGVQLDGIVKTTDMYNLMCLLSNIQPVPNNGSLQRITPLLSDSSAARTLHASVYTVFLVICLFFFQ